MNSIKIQISPEVREFNDAIETADVLTDYKSDRQCAAILLEAVKDDGHLPAHAEWLANAIAGLAIKRDTVRPPCECGNLEATWYGDRHGSRQYMCSECATILICECGHNKADHGNDTGECTKCRCSFFGIKTLEH